MGEPAGNQRTILDDLEKITDNHPYSGLAAEALWRVDAWVRERYAQELPPVSVPWWHKVVKPPKPPPHEHHWSKTLRIYNELARDGSNDMVGEIHVKECDGCGAVKSFFTRDRAR